MKSIRNVLLGAAGLVVMSLPAHALTPAVAGDTPLLNSTTTKSIQLAQAPKRNENPGGAGFRNENPGGAGFRNENPGGAGFNAKPKKKKHKKKKKHM